MKPILEFLIKQHVKKEPTYPVYRYEKYHACFMIINDYNDYKKLAETHRELLKENCYEQAIEQLKQKHKVGFWPDFDFRLSYLRVDADNDLGKAEYITDITMDNCTHDYWVKQGWGR